MNGKPTVMFTALSNAKSLIIACSWSSNMHTAALYCFRRTPRHRTVPGGQVPLLADFTRPFDDRLDMSLFLITKQTTFSSLRIESGQGCPGKFLQADQRLMRKLDHPLHPLLGQLFDLVADRAVRPQMRHGDAGGAANGGDRLRLANEITVRVSGGLPIRGQGDRGLGLPSERRCRIAWRKPFF